MPASISSMTYRNAKRGAVSPGDAKPRRGDMFIVTVIHPYSFCFSAGRRMNTGREAAQSRSAAPLKNKKGNWLVSLYYKRDTPTGFGLQNSKSRPSGSEYVTELMTQGAKVPLLQHSNTPQLHDSFCP